jgi:hypothetical protein
MVLPKWYNKKFEEFTSLCQKKTFCRNPTLSEWTENNKVTNPILKDNNFDMYRPDFMF